jgi:hypothetical protein
MYSPDRVFVNDLKKLDPNLGCHYEPDHHHFVITYKRAVGTAVPIMLIKTADGGFRHPDQRDIIKLAESDTHRIDAMAQIKKAADYMERERARIRQKARDDIRNMTKDDKLQLAPKVARLDGGKHNSTFRRINLKPRGKSVNELQNAINY